MHWCNLKNCYLSYEMLTIHTTFDTEKRSLTAHASPHSDPPAAHVRSLRPTPHHCSLGHTLAAARRYEEAFGAYAPALHANPGDVSLALEAEGAAAYVAGAATRQGNRRYVDELRETRLRLLRHALRLQPASMEARSRLQALVPNGAPSDPLPKRQPTVQPVSVTPPTTTQAMPHPQPDARGQEAPARANARPRVQKEGGRWSERMERSRARRSARRSQTVSTCCRDSRTDVSPQKNGRPPNNPGGPT